MALANDEGRDGLAEIGARVLHMTPEELAQRFHEMYERLAPEHGYETREASAKPWDEVPQQNRELMIHVCSEILDGLEKG